MDTLNGTTDNKGTSPFFFGKTNYMIMIGGIALMVLGFVLMSLETAEYGFGTLGLYVGPILLALGLIVEFAAILYKGKFE